MKELRITVSGLTGTGKTTVAYLIADFLSHTGFKTNINMADEIDVEKFELSFPDRLNSLLNQDVWIDVEESQTIRPNTEDVDPSIIQDYLKMKTSIEH